MAIKKAAGEPWSGRAGGETVGLEHLKPRASLERKIGREKIGREMKRGLSVNEAVARINDALRYTMIYPEESLAVGTRRTLADLKAQGYEIRDVKNYFQAGNSYKGVVGEMRMPDGQPFELQFHTSESFELKMQIHEDYEVFRDGNQPLELRQQALDRMMERRAELRSPPGIELLGRSVRTERPAR